MNSTRAFCYPSTRSNRETKCVCVCVYTCAFTLLDIFASCPPKEPLLSVYLFVEDNGNINDNMQRMRCFSIGVLKIQPPCRYTCPCSHHLRAPELCPPCHPSLSECVLLSHHESVRSHKCVHYWSKPRIYKHVRMQEDLFFFNHSSDWLPHISGVWQILPTSERLQLIKWAHWIVMWLI